MKFAQARFVAAVALLTTVSLAGSIALPFLIMKVLDNQFGIIDNPHKNELALLVFGLTIILGSLLAGGALWGWGISQLTKIKTSSLVRSGATLWVANVFAAGFVLYFSQLLGPPLQQITAVRIHTLFTIFFTLAIGLTVASVSYRMTGRIGFDSARKEAAKKAGLAAMVGFFMMSMILLHVFRWEVGGPFAGRRYSMISIMDVCNTGAALLGGAVMAWTWLRSMNVAWKGQYMIVDH